MRPRIAIVVVVAVMIGLVALVAPSGGATTSETCTHVSGAALFQPPLPAYPGNTRVPLKITTNGMRLYTCTGPGGTLGNVTLTVTSPTKTNCKFVASIGFPTTTSGTATIKWAKGQPSTIAVKLTWSKKSLSPQLTGTVTAGQFKGLTASGTLTFIADVRMCVSAPLSKVTLRLPTGSNFVLSKPAPPTTTTTTESPTTTSTP